MDDGEDGADDSGLDGIATGNDLDPTLGADPDTAPDIDPAIGSGDAVASIFIPRAKSAGSALSLFRIFFASFAPSDKP